MNLARTLREGGCAVGTMVRLTRSPAIVPLAGAAGFDFIMLDFEHGDHGLQTLADVAVAGQAAGLAVLVRVPELSRGWVSRCLDAGAAGVMVPMIESAEQARRIVDWSKYPPLGGRGLSSFGPNTGYRATNDVAELMAQANRDVLAIAQIETVPGVEACEQIAAVEGSSPIAVSECTPLGMKCSVSSGVPTTTSSSRDPAVSSVDRPT